MVLCFYRMVVGNIQWLSLKTVILVFTPWHTKGCGALQSVGCYGIDSRARTTTTTTKSIFVEEDGVAWKISPGKSHPSPPISSLIIAALKEEMFM